MTKKQDHQVAAAALAYIRCTCGWENKLTTLRGKTDEDLALESGSAFVKHKDAQGE